MMEINKGNMRYAAHVRHKAVSGAWRALENIVINTQLP